MPEAQALPGYERKAEVAPRVSILQKFQALFQKVVDVVMKKASQMAPRSTRANVKATMRLELQKTNPELASKVGSETTGFKTMPVTSAKGHVEGRFREAPVRTAQGHVAGTYKTASIRTAEGHVAGTFKKAQKGKKSKT